MKDSEILNKIEEMIIDIGDEGRRLLTIFVAKEVIEAIDEKRNISAERLLFLYKEVNELQTKLRKKRE